MRYRKGEIAQKKQLEWAIAKRAAVSIVLARRIIADLEKARVTPEPNALDPSLDRFSRTDAST
jgi:hypothetical protein